MEREIVFGMKWGSKVMKILKLGMMLLMWVAMMQDSPARMGMSLDQCKKMYGKVVDSTLVRTRIADGHEIYDFEKNVKAYIYENKTFVLRYKNINYSPGVEAGLLSVNSDGGWRPLPLDEFLIMIEYADKPTDVERVQFVETRMKISKDGKIVSYWYGDSFWLVASWYHKKIKKIGGF